MGGSRKQAWLYLDICGFVEIAQADTHQAKALFGTRSSLSRRLRAISVSSSQVDGGTDGVWLRVRILNSLVLSLRTTVRATRVSLREAAQTFCASRRIMGSVPAMGRSCSKVSSAETDLVERSGTTSPGSTPRASS